VWGSEWAHGTVWRAATRRACVPEISQHDREASSDINHLFPPLLLNQLGAGRLSRSSQHYGIHAGLASFQRPPRSVINGRPQVSANVGTVLLSYALPFLFSIRMTGICFGTKSSILRLDTPDNPSKPCLSCTKQWCLNQNLPICAGASLGDTDPDTATGKEGDVEARCFRM